MRSIALGCVLTAGLLAGAGEARAQTETEHWSATLTRGVDGKTAGYVAASTGDNAIGMLDPSTVTYESLSYTVNRLYVATRDAILVFETTPALPADAELVLRVPTLTSRASVACPLGGTADFDLDASNASSSVTGRYQWSTRSGTCMNPDAWSRDLATTHTVKLVVPDTPKPTLSVGDAEGDEGDDVTFTVTLSEAAPGDVTASWTWSTESGDTAGGRDVAAPLSGRVTIRDGQMMATFAVRTIEDTTEEGDETFTVTLSVVSTNARLAPDPTATGTIIDDDGQTGPDLVVESPSVTDSTPTSGTTFTLSATVRNAGDGASAATTLRFYRSTDSTITTSDTVQGINAETVTGLAASESSSSHSLDILAPPAPVQFYYGACVTAVADESDTTNNCSGSVLVRVQAQTTVTIAADHESFTAVLDQVTFTLTRTGDLAEGLDVSVALTQDKDLIGSDHLAQTVTFRAGEATATLNIHAYFFAGNTVTGETALTATVQDGSGYVPGSLNTASTRIRVADPAVTASFEQAAYTFDEAAGDATVAVILRTATGVPVPHADIFFYINSAAHHRTGRRPTTSNSARVLSSSFHPTSRRMERPSSPARK